jgi:hypothetical protein
MLLKMNTNVTKEKKRKEELPESSKQKVNQPIPQYYPPPLTKTGPTDRQNREKQRNPPNSTDKTPGHNPYPVFAAYPMTPPPRSVLSQPCHPAPK